MVQRSTALIIVTSFMALASLSHQFTITAHSHHHDLVQTVRSAYKAYSRSGVRPLHLNATLSQLPLRHFFRKHQFPGKIASKFVTNIEDNLICTLCDGILSFVFEERRKGMSDIQIKSEAVAVCELLQIESPRACQGIIELNSDVILWIVDNNPNLAGNTFCDLVLQDYRCNFTNIDWTVEVPEGQSTATLPKPENASSIKILQISDMHVDPMYQPNKVKICSEPLCCQSDQEDGIDGNSCGYWGEFGNDISNDLVDEVIRFASTFDVDYVYFTGDIISHRIWSTTPEGNAATIDQFLKKLKKGFSVPVYPILGNHESSPLNQFVFNSSIPGNLSTQWLFDLIKSDWAEWLPDSAMETIDKGGFYTVSPEEGFRIIVLNNNVAYKVCWWLMQENKDPFGQLEWLVDVLKEAETKNERIHILAHIPTGFSDMFHIWGREFNRIVNRFANTITAQFSGHVHVDTFQVRYNISNASQAVNVEWNGASLVPYDNANPSFKIYTIEKETFQVVDIEQWTFNLTAANQNTTQQPDWYKVYSFKDVFDMNGLQPKDLDNLLLRMARNHTLLGEYHLLRYKNSDPAIASTCDETCQKAYLCEFSTSIHGEVDRCEFLKSLYDQYL